MEKDYTTLVSDAVFSPETDEILVTDNGENIIQSTQIRILPNNNLYTVTSISEPSVTNLESYEFSIDVKQELYNLLKSWNLQMLYQTCIGKAHLKN